MPSTLTRRAALGAGALVLASCGGGDPPPTGRPRAGSGAGLLNSIVALEHAAVAAWAAIAELLSREAQGYARTIQARESEHVRRLSGLVLDLGGTPPEGRSAEEYARSFPRMRDRSDALRFAADLEERLVRGYLDALRSLPEEEQRRVAAETAAQEAEDLAVVHALAGEPVAPHPFVTGTL